MSTFLNGLKEQTNYTTTSNGAVAHKTTHSHLVDLFATGGALRARTSADKIQLFSKAFAENPLVAMKILFYIRDIRGGQGERQTFRDIVKYLAFEQEETLRINLWAFPEYGRWDDLVHLLGTPVEDKVVELIHDRLVYDLKSDTPSLLAKWLPSENASSKETKRLAKLLRNKLGLESKEYRKMLSTLRGRINLVETKMSSNDWFTIDYPKLPSKAGLKYRGAFYRHDESGYTSFIDGLKKGTQKINAKTLFPYEIIHEFKNFGSQRFGNHLNINYGVKADSDVLEAMWNNLPDYVGDNFTNALAVVDTSWSMNGQPAEVALSLGLYVAERNKGEFHNHFITFSGKPELQEIIGSNLGEKLANMSKAEWGMNTDIEAVFNLILDTAIEKSIPQDEMPSKLFIISDMQFDRASRNKKTIYKAMAEKFEDVGYVLPEIVFWNVNASSTQFPVTVNESGVALVSGCSPSIFKNLLAGKDMTPYAMMMDVIDTERYDLVRV